MNKAGILLVVLPLLSAAACKNDAAPSPRALPAPWAALGIPVKGLKRVLPKTGANGLFADYTGYGDRELFEQVGKALEKRGYKRACTAFEGLVRGFAKGGERLAMKVDQIGEVHSLSVFNERAGDRLLFGVCFGKYVAGKKTSR